MSAVVLVLFVPASFVSEFRFAGRQCNKQKHGSEALGTPMSKALQALCTQRSITNYYFARQSSKQWTTSD